MDKKHENIYKKFCAEELERLKAVKTDQRLWDFRNLNTDKLAAVERVQQRWIKFQTYNYQMFNTGDLDLLPSHEYHHYTQFIEQLHSQMQKKDRSILLHGPSGSGKSVLTGILAKSFNSQYQNKCIIRVFTFVLPTAGNLSPAATQLHYERQIEMQYELWARSLAKKLQMPQMISNLSHREGLLLEVTRLLNLAGSPWLLIVENIPDPMYWHLYHQTKPFLTRAITNTRAQGNTLIVSQKKFHLTDAIKHYAIIEINTNNLIDDGFQLLHHICSIDGNTETAAAMKLIKMTNCLPAALAMAAVFISQQCASKSTGKICTYKAYIDLIENYSSQLSTINACKALLYSPAVIAIIKCSIGAIDDEAKRTSVDSLMNFLCTIAETPVTYSMLYHHWQRDKSAPSAPIRLNKIIITAERLNLLRRIRISQLDQDTFIVPNLVYKVWSTTLNDLPSNVKLQYLQSIVPDKQQLTDSQKSLHEKFTLPHVITLLKSLTQDCTQQFCEPRLIATYGAADTARFWGNNEEAARLFLAGLTQLHNCKHQSQHYLNNFNTAKFENGLSIVKNLQGEPKSGLLHGEQASSYYDDVANQKSAQGDIKFSLGRIHLELGDYPTAEDMLTNALQYRKEVHGEESDAVANSASGLGLLLSIQDRFEDAVIMHKQAIQINERSNPKSKLTATSYHDYGVSLTAKGDYRAAINQHEASIKLRELILGVDHHQAITSYNSIGCSFYFMGESLRLKGKNKEAIEAYKRALTYHEKALYSDIKRHSLHHPYTLISLLNEVRVLIRLQQNGHEVDDAIRASERTLCNIAMPSNRMHVLWIMHYLVLAQRHEWQNRYSLAEINYIKALECAKTIYGPTHTQVATIYFYLYENNSLRYQAELMHVLSKIQNLHSDHWLKQIKPIEYSQISYL